MTARVVSVTTSKRSISILRRDGPPHGAPTSFRLHIRLMLDHISNSQTRLPSGLRSRFLRGCVVDRALEMEPMDDLSDLM